MELQKKEDPLLRKKERPNIAKNQNRHLTLYKNNCGLIINRKVVARLPASDFPAENPRTQTRNYYYTWRYLALKTLTRTQILRKKYWDLNQNVADFKNKKKQDCGILTRLRNKQKLKNQDCGKTNRSGKKSKFAELLNAENHSKKEEKTLYLTDNKTEKRIKTQGNIV